MRIKLGYSKIIACDIDNTVANQKIRFEKNFDFKLRVLKAKAFDREEMLNDVPIRHSVIAINSLSNYYNIVWVSARKKKWKARTVEWLKKHRFPYKNIYLLDQNDNKIDILKRLRPMVFIDDMKYNWENLDPKPCTNFMNKLDSLNINYKIFNDNWKEILKRFEK